MMSDDKLFQSLIADGERFCDSCWAGLSMAWEVDGKAYIDLSRPETGYATV